MGDTFHGRALDIHAVRLIFGI